MGNLLTSKASEVFSSWKDKARTTSSQTHTCLLTQANYCSIVPRGGLASKSSYFIILQSTFLNDRDSKLRRCWIKVNCSQF